nr:MAG TPA: hypothetical protein [Caudoviricetes sp.]
MDYEKLKEVIAKQIKENGRGEITGPVLQSVLMVMVDSLGEVYPQTYTDEQKAQARANIDALSDHNGEITKEKLSIEVQAILNDVANKQNITDESLATQAKTIVGAINELTNKEGLLFLGILGPNDPAPSNEPTKGYYLSFQASTKETPYFNGVHLHRYSMLIWTQDDTGRWTFEKVKYEDHRGPKRVVVGRALPIHFDKNMQNFTVHLSGDGTRDTYAVCGMQVLRGEKNGKLANYLQNINGCGRKSKDPSQYVFIQFREEDDGITLNQRSLSDFIADRIIEGPISLRACSEAYEIFGNRISWRPKIQGRIAEMTRKVKDNSCRAKPDGEYAKKMFAVKNIPSAIIKGPYEELNGEYRRAKRYKWFDGKKRAAGLSENYIKVYNQNTLY